MKRLTATEDVPTTVKRLVADVDDPAMLAGYWYDRCVGVAKEGQEARLMTISDGLGRMTAMAIITPSDDQPDTPDTLELIVVSKESRGNGVGSRMINAIIALHDDRPLLLEVHVDNHRAIALYRRLGFRMSDIRGDYIVMRMSPHVRSQKR